MATSSIDYTATGTALTCTVTSLADDGYRESAAVTNATNKYLSVLIGGSIQVGTVTADGSIKVYAYASADGGTTYSGGLVGTDETITWGTTPSTSSVNGFNNLFLLGIANVDDTDDDNDIEFGPFVLEAAFGGIVPEDWGIVIKNETGVAFHATGTNNTLHYSGIKATSV
jgi:hypothetical protein